MTMTTPSPTPILLQPAENAGSTPPRWPHDGRARAVVEAVLPAVDGGRFAAKCIAGEPFAVTAHCFTDGHDALRVVLQWRAEGNAATTAPTEVPMQLLGNDEWRASFVPPVPGRYHYTVVAWVDALDSWRREQIGRAHV